MDTINTNRILSIFIFMAAVVVAASTAEAQGYPNRFIRFIVPFASGGPTDTIARVVAQGLSEGIGQQVVLDNRPGANAIVGTELGAKAPPDGYTIIMESLGYSVNPSLYKKLPYDTFKDFAPLIHATSGPLLLAAHPSVPANDIKGLIALARPPGQITCGSSGIGSAAHLALALMTSMAGIDIMHIPYKGAPQGITDLLGGQISLYFGGVVALLPHVKSGKVKGIAVTTRNRSAAAPGIPTITESGIPGYEMSGWYGVVVPARTPKEIITQLNGIIAAYLHKPEVKQKIEASGAEVVASTPEQFGAYLEADAAKWAKVIKAVGMKAD